MEQKSFESTGFPKDQQFPLASGEYPLLSGHPPPSGAGFGFDGGVWRILEELLTHLLSYSQRKREEVIFKIWEMQQ
jgi:hypothetical protein